MKLRPLGEVCTARQPQSHPLARVVVEKAEEVGGSESSMGRGAVVVPVEVVGDVFGAVVGAVVGAMVPDKHHQCQHT